MNSNISRISIPSQITHIGDGTFRNSQNLDYVEIKPDSTLVKIMEAAFYNTKIDEFIIPSSVTSIGDYAFNETSIESLDIPEDSKLTKISESAFANCSELKKVTIPRHVKKNCRLSFVLCFNLQNVEIPSDLELEDIEEGAFYTNQIKKLFIPSHVKILRSNAIYSINTITLEFPPNSELQEIENINFYAINIPAGVTELSITRKVHE